MFKKRRKDTRSYKNFKHWTTAKLKEVLDEPYYRGVDGHDYAPYIEEMQDIYYARITKNTINMVDKMIEERYGK
jgi:hypothetical protein